MVGCVLTGVHSNLQKLMYVYVVSVCAGNSQSYAGGDWSKAVASPNAELYSGNLPSGKEIVRFSVIICAV